MKALEDQNNNITETLAIEQSESNIVREQSNNKTKERDMSHIIRKPKPEPVEKPDEQVRPRRTTQIRSSFMSR